MARRVAVLLLPVAALLTCGSHSNASIEPVLRIVGPAQFTPPTPFAWTIASVRDFNGDGFEDLVVGGPVESKPSLARIYFGGPAADSVEDVVLQQPPLLTTYIGIAVSSAGDMNGDGFGDIVVSTPSGRLEGQAQVYFGGRNPDGIADLRLREEPDNEPINFLVFKPGAAAADFNGDGFDDVLLGAPGAHESGYYWDPLGRAYLFLGSALPNGDADLFIESPSTPTLGNDFLGFGGVVAPAGDLNGDRFGDFVVAPFHEYNSLPFVKTYVYLGGENIDSLPDASIATGPWPGQFGQRVLMTSAGDLNADGLNDFAMVAGTTRDPARPDRFAKRVQVYLGKGTMSFDTEPDLVLDPGGAGGQPTSVAGGRDVNGDGHPDLIVGSASPAAAYVYLGGPGLDPFPDITLTGERPDSWFGATVANMDWTGDSVADVVVTAPFRRDGVPPRVFIYDVADPLRARALSESDRRTIAIAESAPTPLRVRFEPIDGSYASADVDPQTIRLRSEGTGEVTEIPAVAGKATLEGDRDGNGVPDLLASFSGADLARLFSNVAGRKIVDVTLEGRLRSRRRFAAPFSLTIVGAGPRGELAATVLPNPLNPRGALAFHTASRGIVTARLFDLHGRCMRTLLQAQSLHAGDHRIPIDGRDDAGRELASGVYFYRVDTADGPARGRLVVAK